MNLPYTSIRAFLLLAVLSGGRSASPQASVPGQGQASPPKGKVLFERHEGPMEGAPTVPEADRVSDSPAQQTVPAKPGESSSQRHSRTTLHRRSAASTENGATAVQGAVPDAPASLPTAGPEASFSVDAQNTEPHSQPIVTEDDLAAARQIPSAERRSIALTARDLDVHLNSHTGEVEVRAQVTVRNTGHHPVKTVALRISGALRWQAARVAGLTGPLPVQQHLLPDDLDHTGLANEVGVSLPSLLQPGEVVSLDTYYGGTIMTSAQRLLAIGAPAGRAAQTDWDTVTDNFTGLRGLGSVLWYPVTGESALLRDGDAVTRAVELSRINDAGSRFQLQLTLQYEESRPEAGFFCGERQALLPLAGAETVTSKSGFVTARWTREHLGLHTPSLFVASGAPRAMAGGSVEVVTDRPEAAAATGEAAARIQPMLAEWLGAAPQSALHVIDLPIPGAAGFVDGVLLVAPLSTALPAVLAPSLVQPLTSAWLPTEIAAPWLRDGIPAFLQAVWVERTAGRAAALAGLAAGSIALRAQSVSFSAEARFSSSQPQAEQALSADPVATCVDPLCARNKAAYVFEMLRTMLGDAGLQQAISGWAVQQSQAPGRSAAQETAGMERLLQQIAGKKDLFWFFSSWINADRGLPDLKIVLVAPRRVERATAVISLPQARRPVAGPIGAEPVAPTDPRDMNERDAEALAAANGGGAGPVPGSWMVAVEVQNAGGADAEVPVTVRSGGFTNTQPLRIAAHSRATIRVPFEADPAEVLVNDGSVPEVDATLHRKSIGSLPTPQ